jgi:phage terminase large subunit
MSFKLVFDTHGNDKQKQVARYWIDKETSDIVYGGSKGSGKSYLGCSLIFGDAFLYPETHYFIARKKLNDIRKFTIPSIHEVFSHWGLNDKYYKYNGQDSIFELYNKSKIFLLDAKYLPSDPQYYRFGSMQMTRGWIEEAGEFEEEAKNNLNASIGRWKNDVYNLPPKLLQTCNPSKNYLYREYYRKHKDGNIEQWKKYVQALPEDNKQLPDGYIANLHRILSPNEKERLLYGNWEYDDDPSVLCEYDAILDIFTNQHVLKTGKKYISADLAMQGRDRYVAGVWDGLVCDLTIGADMSKANGKIIEESIKSMMIKHRVPHSSTVVDSDGLGAYLESYLNGIKEFHGNSKANEAEYINKKTECAYKLAELINKREIYVICNEAQKKAIIEELEQLKADDIDNDTGKKRIIKKEKMKELLARSPDYLDMLLMRMYFETTRKEYTFYSID